MMGSQAGFEEDRGQMFFRIMDILAIKKPKYVLLRMSRIFEIMIKEGHLIESNMN